MWSAPLDFPEAARYFGRTLRPTTGEREGGGKHSLYFHSRAHVQAAAVGPSWRKSVEVGRKPSEVILACQIVNNMASQQEDAAAA